MKIRKKHKILGLGFCLFLGCLMIAGCGEKKEDETLNTSKENTIDTNSSIEADSTESSSAETSSAKTDSADTGSADSDDWYQNMLETSVLSTGTNGRLEKVLDKLDKGEKVTIAAIGGSVTEGAGAANTLASYGDLFIMGLKQLYPDAQISYVNAGLGGTPSSLGIMRYDRDVVQAAGGAPDLVIIEFSVNDYKEVTSGRAFESLVRTALDQENDPAVVLMFAVFRTKWNMQSNYTPIGTLYGLPMVSAKDAIAVAYNAGEMTDAEYFADEYHPTSYGHSIMADCLLEMVKECDKNREKANISELPSKGYYSADFVGMKLLPHDGDSNATVTLGGFSGADTRVQSSSRTRKSSFPENWMHASDSGNASFKVELNCKNILLNYKTSSSQDFGTACVYVDGNLVHTLDGYSAGGWNNSNVVLALDEDTSGTHTLEVKMADGQESKAFTILTIGYTE